MNKPTIKRLRITEDQPPWVLTITIIHLDRSFLFRSLEYLKKPLPTTRKNKSNYSAVMEQRPGLVASATFTVRRR